MLAPVTRWVKQISNGLLFNADNVVSSGPLNHNLTTALQSISPLNTNVVNPLLQPPRGNGSVNQMIPPPSMQGTTTRAFIEDPLAQSSLMLNSFSPTRIGFGTSRTLDSNLHSLPDLGAPSGTMTLPPALGQQPAQPNISQPCYFTFDGQHRKFYLSARYLRSAQRQRRHKRRLAQRLKEQARVEMNQLQNAISYGHARNTKARNTIEEKKASPSSECVFDRGLEISSNSSEMTNDNGIPLLCWKDIDLDLEVRSIDDDSELARLTRKASIERDGRATLVQEPQIPRPRTYHPHLPQKVLNSVGTEGADAPVAQLLEKIPVVSSYRTENETRKRSTIPTLKRMWPSTRHNKVSAMQESLVLEKMNAPLAETNSPGESTITNLHSLRPVPAANPRVGPNITVDRTKAQLISCHKQSVSSDSMTDAVLNQPLTHQKRNLKQHSTLPLFSQNIIPIPAIKSSASFQNEHMRSLLQSTVISNPAALESADSQLEERTFILNKSRLSLASSRGDLNSDVQVQLSYYSQQESIKTEEDLSFFSFRDAYSVKEDISKVTVPISLSLFIMTTYILIGATVFSKWENEGYLKWSYFCFITLSTIGFGDIVPGEYICPLVRLNFRNFPFLFFLKTILPPPILDKVVNTHSFT